MEDYTARTTCRACKGSLESVLNLGNLHISTFLDTQSDVPKVPLHLMECVSCGLLQLEHTVNSKLLYSEYWYKSGLNQSMVVALKDVVDKTLDHVKLEKGDVIVDIGANDGTLLRQYPEWVQDSTYSIAYEPSNVGDEAKNACNVLIKDYFSAIWYDSLFSKRAKIITSIAMFYDLEDPHSFIEDAKNVLDKEGVWTIQLMDLISMLKTNDFPNLCHEHLLYYKLLDIVRLLAEHDLTVFDCEYNDVNGQSVRVYVCHNGVKTISHNVIKALIAEDQYLGKHANIGAHFKKAVEAVRSKVVTFIRDRVADGDTVAVLGASTKGNTILQYFGLTEHDIDHAAEINADKFGKCTVGSNVPIISQQDSLNRMPSYYLILPWGFLPNFLNRFEHYLRDGGAFIVPLPEPAVYTFDSDTGVQAWPL